MLMKRLILLLWVGICFSYSIGYAQPYPVTTGIVVTSYPAYLDQYAQPNNTIVTLLSTDSRTVYNARVKIIVSGEGFTLKTKSTYQPGPVYLYKDQPLVLTGLSLAPYFDINNLDMEGLSYSDLLNSGGRLPDGPVSICVEVYDYYRENEPPVSNTACSYGTIQAFLPPIIVSPMGSHDLTAPQNVLLSWQSQHFGAFPVQYTVEIYRDNLGFSPDVTITSSAPLFTLKTSLQTYNYNAADPLLSANEDYLMRVRVEDLMGATTFENEGWSEIQTFTMVGATAMLAQAVDCYEVNETLCVGHCSMTYNSLIMSDGTTYTANINYSGATSGLQAWLNSLNVGDFTVTENAQAPNAFGNCQVDLVISGLIPVNQAIKPQEFKINAEFNNSCSTGQADPVPYTTNTYNFSQCGQTDPVCLPPSNATIASLTANSMVVDWDIPGGATVDFFSVSVSQAGASDPLLYPVNLPASSLTVDNLQANTNYTVSICTHCADGSDPQCVTLDQITTPGDQASTECFKLEESFCLGDCAAFYPQFHTATKTYTPNQGFWGSPSGLEDYLNSLNIGTYTVTEVKTPNNQWGFCGLDLTITAIVPLDETEKPVGLTIDAKYGESCTTGEQDNVGSSLKTFDFTSCDGAEPEPEPDCAPPIDPLVVDVSTREIDLNWGIPSGANIFVKGFQVKHRLANSGDAFTSVKLGATVQSYTITGLSGLQAYEIEICTECDAGLVECKNLGTVTTYPIAICPTPEGLQEMGITATTIALQWDALGDLELNNVIDFELRYRVVGSTDPFSTVAIAKTATTYNIENLSDQTNYEIELCTHCTENGPSCSALGPLLTGDPQVCEVPKLLTLDESTPNSLQVSWTNDNALGIDEIEVAIKRQGQTEILQNQTLLGSATSFSFTGLTAEQSYEISVCFYCENNDIACSSLTATTWPVDEVLCPPIADVNVEASTLQSITLSWIPPEGLNATLLTYRKAGTTPYENVIGTGQTEWTFEPLEEGTEYEFKLYYICEDEEIVTTILASTIHAGKCVLAESNDLEYSCGTDPSIELGNSALASILEVEDQIWAGDFLVTISQVTDGSPFTGKGYMEVPYLNEARFNVEFRDITIDDQCQLRSGFLEVTGVGLAILSDQVLNAITNVLDVLETVDDILETIEDILDAIDQVFEVAEDYLPPEVIQQLLNAQEQLIQAIIDYEEAENMEEEQLLTAESVLLTAQEALAEANQAYVEALTSFLGNAFDILRQALVALANEFGAELSGLSVAYNHSESTLDIFIQDRMSFLDAVSPPSEPSNLQNYYLDVLHRIPAVEGPQTYLGTTEFIGKSTDYLDDGAAYFLPLILANLDAEISGDLEVEDFLELLQQEGVDLLQTIGEGINGGLSEDAIVQQVKNEIKDIIETILRKVLVNQND